MHNLLFYFLHRFSALHWCHLRACYSSLWPLLYSERPQPNSTAAIVQGNIKSSSTARTYLHYVKQSFCLSIVSSEVQRKSSLLGLQRRVASTIEAHSLCRTNHILHKALRFLSNLFLGLSKIPKKKISGDDQTQNVLLKCFKQFFLAGILYICSFSCLAASSISVRISFSVPRNVSFCYTMSLFSKNESTKVSLVIFCYFIISTEE